MTNQTTTTLYVEMSGPWPNATAQSDWEEFPEWVVCLCTEDGEPLADPMYRVRNHDRAYTLVEKMATDRQLEFEYDASPNW